MISKKTVEQAKRHYRDRAYQQAHFQLATKSILISSGITPFEQGYYFAFNDQIFSLTSKFGNGNDGKQTVIQTAYAFCARYVSMLGSKFDLAICNKILELYSIPAYIPFISIEFEKAISLLSNYFYDWEFQKAVSLLAPYSLGLEFNKTASLFISKYQITKLTTIRPSANFSVMLTPEPIARANWNCVDEVTPDDTDFVWEGNHTTWQSDLYHTVSASIPATSTINYVKLYFRVRKDSVKGCVARPRIRALSQAITEGSAVALGDSWENKSQTWLTNPQTGLAWTVAEANDLDIGIGLRELTAIEGWTLCSQLYAEIEFALLTV